MGTPPPALGLFACLTCGGGPGEDVAGGTGDGGPGERHRVPPHICHPQTGDMPWGSCQGGGGKSVPAPWGSPHPAPGPPAITLPQPAAATAQSLDAPLGSSPAPGVRCSLGPMQLLTGDGGDGGRLALPAASQAGDADVVAPAWLQPPQVIGAGSGWELLAALGPPCPGGERGEGGVRHGGWWGCRGAGWPSSPSARRQTRRYPALPATGTQARRRRCSEASVTWKLLTGGSGAASAVGQRSRR